MPIKWEKLENNKIKLEIEVPSPEVDTALSRAYRKVVAKVNLPGFRRGKIPRRVLEMRFGPEVLYDDALEILIPEAYRRAIKEADLEPIDEPQIECHQLESGKPLIFEAVVDVMPEVVLGPYKGVEVEQEEVVVTDEQVDKHLEGLRDQQARLVTLPAGEGTAEKGDLVIINFKGFIDGEPFEGGEAENYSLELGSKSFIEGFEDQLLGVSIGEEREVDVTFPADYYREEFASKQALFQVVVNEIKRKQLPELNDEFGKEIGDFENLEELKADIRKRLTKTARERSKQQLEDSLIKKVSEAAQVELPEVLVERQLDKMMTDMDQFLRYQGLSLEKFAEMTEKTIEEIRQEKRPEAEGKAKSAAVLNAIVKQEGIVVEDPELDQKIGKIAKTYNEQPERVKELFGKQGRLQVMEKEIKLKKVINLLLEEARIRTVKAAEPAEDHEPADEYEPPAPGPVGADDPVTVHEPAESEPAGEHEPVE